LNEVDYYDSVFDKQTIDRLLDTTFQHNVPVKILTANLTKKSNRVFFLIINSFRLNSRILRCLPETELVPVTA
jgi:hypothetical protein